jgi:hypothetical protein
MKLMKISLKNVKVKRRGARYAVRNAGILSGLEQRRSHVHVAQLLGKQLSGTKPRHIL